MKKLKSVPVKYLLVFIFSITFFYSCSEDPVTSDPVDPKYIFDTARFDWKIDTIQNVFSPISLSSIDTNDIYILDSYRTLNHYNGSDFERTYLPFEVLGLTVKAYVDKLFIGGIYLISSDYFQPALLVKEGNSFTEIEIPDSNQQYAIFSIERTNDNVLWLGTQNGRLIKYESGLFTYFGFDSSYFVRVHKDKNENVFAVNSIIMYDSIGNNGKMYLEIYKYESESFKKLYSKFFENIDDNTFTVSIVDGEIYARNWFGIYKFSGNDFTKIIDFPDIAKSLDFSGSSNNDILIEGVFLPFEGKTNLFHWDGFKWSNELEIFIGGGYGISEKLRENYIFVSQNDPYETFLVIGSPKN
ncbi:MAG: hypothetical protein IPM38_11530 [Ignavibacteria bacterium]|nr:hypothetical protein [Ignavibacteria bacterium]